MRFTSRIDSKAFEELVRPKLRLFLSVDIVGSSDFKYQQSSGPGAGWVFPFLSFYQTFPEFLDQAVEECQTTKKKVKAPALEKPRLWKALGDELIFVVELQRRMDAAHYLRSFRRALQRASRNWLDNSHRFQFKGTAWLAGFPLGNVEVPVVEQPGVPSSMPDFVGPQIDAGFRLKDHATPRKLVLSADLAYLLVVTRGHQLHLFFDGDQPLKGIMRGKPYPLVWLDGEVSDNKKGLSLQQKKDLLMGRKPASKQRLESYLDAWLMESGNQVPRPFIESDPFKSLRPPPDYGERLRAWEAKLNANLLVVNESQGQGNTSLPPSLEKLLHG